MKEKLEFLIKNALAAHGNLDPSVCSAESFLADFLIANGASVPKWISVKDRLPNDDDFKDDEPSRCWIVHRVYNLLDISIYTDVVEDAYWVGNGFITKGSAFTPYVSHWMPYTAPMLPKED